MKKTVIVLSLLCVSLLFYACSTDFSTIAPYKETMVIYGLLNQDTSVKTQYIRISRAFLGEGNSLIMAQQKDSINYGDVLVVKIQRIQNGIVTQTFTLQRTDTNLKDPGIFNSPSEILYKGVFSPNANSNYKLIVYNKSTGLTATAQTRIIGNIDFANPPFNDTMKFTPSGLYEVNINTTSYAWIYNFTLRFYYTEVNQVTNVSTPKYVDWNFGDQVVGATPPSNISYDHIYRPDLYRIIGSVVAPADTHIIKRYIDAVNPIEFIFTGGTEELNTYLQLNQPSYGIVQDLPLYTNLENGIGLFTGRTTTSYPLGMDNASRNAFDTSVYTKKILFNK